MSDDDGLGDVWSLVIPRFDMLFSGSVEAATPFLVLVIWFVAGYACWYAYREARRAKAWIADSAGLFDSLEPNDLWARRMEIDVAAISCSQPVQDAWREFSETLVTDNRRLYNTVSAEEFFNEHRFAPRLVGNRFLHAAPTALTTIGLLGTFFGLTIGLRGLDLGSTSDQVRIGIQTLVDGAALGFTASLWGVFMSLVTNIFERWQERQVVASIRRLQAQIDGLFSMRSPEQSLSDIAAHTSESKEALQVLHEKVGSALQESVKNVGEDTSRAVTDAIHASLTPIMTDLAKMASDQSAEVFKEVSSQLTASFKEMGQSLAEQLKASSDALRSTVDHLGEQLTRQAEQNLAQMSDMQISAARHLDDLRTTTTQQMDQLRETTTSQLVAVTAATERQLLLLDDALPRVVTQLDRAASLIGTATTGMDEVTSGLTRATTELGETSNQLSHLLAEAIGTMDELADRTATAAGALSAQQGSVTTLAERAVAAADLLRDASSQLNTGFDGMRTAQGVFLTDLEHRLVQHSEKAAESMSAWLTVYADDVSKQTTYRMGEWNAQTERFTSTMLTAAEALSEAIDELSVQRFPQVEAAPA